MANNLKENSKKQLYGQFFTDKLLCNEIIDIINEIKPLSGNVLEPSFGNGHFINSILINSYDIEFDAIEIDKEYYEGFKNDNVNLINEDFIFYDFKKKYDFIIGNPPYIELCYSFYSDDNKKNIKNLYSKIANGRLNLVHCFIVKSLELLKENGILAFLLPSSILTSSYYKGVRKLLFENYSIEYLKENVIFNEVSIKITLLIVRKNKLHNKYFIMNNSDNYYISEKCYLFGYKMTLKDKGFKVNVGNIDWSKEKNRLEDVKTDNNKFLIYSNNIGKDCFLFDNNRNINRKQCIKKEKIKYQNCIIFPRTISKELKYHYIKDNEECVFENHVLILYHDNINTLTQFYEKLNNKNYDELIKCFFNSSNLTTTELLSLPFIE